MDLAATSTEYVHVDVKATIPGNPVALGTPPKFAFLLSSANPDTGDWLDGEWSGGYGRVLIGPNGGATILEVGKHSVWIMFASGLETPIVRAGYITVY